MEKENEMIIIDKANNQITCKILSIIDIENKKYIIYTNDKKLCASQIQQLKEIVDLLPIEDEKVWNKLEKEFTKICKESYEALNKNINY